MNGEKINSIFVIMFATAGLINSNYTLAVDMPAEGQAKCGTCHAIDKNIFGPSFMAISEKYKGDKDAANKIATSITMGGSFGWLFGSMPAKGLGANDSEIQFLSKFIADLAK
ncbi:c-type cytochrome [Candidatus Nitrotoga arctica]|uniref:Cytochrome c551/c552 n=1 Tax=Candidatus Nitrotoga arctica TaxID=453162 RepID=A0ABN8ARX9_9PROT|nr:c-type cytochrome [Candidatus Nitrotoga arctica]CAG9933085.1 Cytochrome c551/c552 [Candidatus Nitrotoga arctica]